VAIFRQRVCVVSRAWYPARTECCVAVSRTAQLRRAFQLFMNALWHAVWTRQKKQMLVQPHGFHVWQERPAPETPMPEAPLIRVLETFDLSSSNIEHFIDSKTDLKAVPNSTAGTLQEIIQ